MIPSRNADNVDACVDSIREAGDDCKIFVVDDGLSRWRADCHYVTNVRPRVQIEPDAAVFERRFVYARSVNEGLRATDGEDVILMGDDTRVVQGSLRQLHAIAGEMSITSASLTGAVGNPNQVHRKYGAGWAEPRMLCFVCVVIPAKVIDLVGSLDERFTDYGCDDDDYCLRASRAGCSLWVDNRVVVEHGVLRSEYRGHGNRSFEYNLKLFMQKWGHDHYGVPNAASKYGYLLDSLVQHA